MKTLLQELIGKQVTLLTDNDAVTTSDEPYRDDGILEAFDGLILRLQKLGNDRLYFPVHSIQKATTAVDAEAIVVPDTAVTEPGGLLHDLLDKPVSVWLNTSRSRTDAILEAYDTEAIRVNTGGQIAYFPLSSVRVLKFRTTL